MGLLDELLLSPLCASRSIDRAPQVFNETLSRTPSTVGSMASEAAPRRALGQLFGWNGGTKEKAEKKSKAKKLLGTMSGESGFQASTPKRSPMRTPGKQQSPLSPDRVPSGKMNGGAQKVPAALPAGTRINVWWSDEEECARHHITRAHGVRARSSPSPRVTLTLGLPAAAAGRLSASSRSGSVALRTPTGGCRSSTAASTRAAWSSTT